MNVPRKQGFQLHAGLFREEKWMGNHNQLGIHALHVCHTACLCIPQGSYAHYACNLSASPRFCTDPLTQAVWLRCSRFQIWRFLCLFSKDYLFSYFILQRLLITRSPWRALNRRLKPTQFITSSWQGLRGVWDIPPPSPVITNSIILLMDNNEYLLRKDRYTHLCSKGAETLSKSANTATETNHHLKWRRRS